MTPQQAAAKLRKINTDLANGVNNAEIAALTDVLGMYKGRVFTDGEATDGTKMGRYSVAYAKKRSTPRSKIKVRTTKEGRVIPSNKTLNTYPISVLPTDKKDLVFFGDLFKNIQIAKSGGDNVIGFTRDIDKLKMKGTEDYLKKEVIPFSQKEKERMILVYQKKISQIMKEV